ncbi:porin [Alcanivorax marinus]|uniref:Porin n=1 Tax=Alloalcanivorax marinus TaxID=1177169 RepID=A0A9Q3ULD1_9GAMM|nr:porin [Alloalcanivorax marinus]MCC4307264.1 porin [Alloalcanivorax marinus]
MKTKIAPALPVLLAGLTPMVAGAIPLAAEKLEIYGALRLSVDYADSDLGDTPENPSAGLVDGGHSLSTNTSVLGLRGRHTLSDQYDLVWQVEQNIDPDSPRNRGIGNRDTFAGFDTPAGLIRFGIMDTPYKRNGIRMSQFTSTVADPQAILGRGGGGNQRLSLRAENSIRWDRKFLDKRLQLALQYGAGQQDTDGVTDNNDSSMWSGAAIWRQGGLVASVAYADWSELYAGGDVSGLNGGLNYRFGAVTVGALFDRLEADNVAYLNRDAWGGFVTWDIRRDYTLGAQWIHADESDAGDDEADQYSLVGTWHAAPALDLYLAATTTVNQGDSGVYRTADYAHGDRVNTVLGGDPKVLSLGMAFKF